MGIYVWLFDKFVWIFNLSLSLFSFPAMILTNKRIRFYVVHEFLANRADFSGKGSTEHHNLFNVGGVFEDILNVFSHIFRKKKEEKKKVRKF